jgi:hypothetical protein
MYAFDCLFVYLFVCLFACTQAIAEYFITLSHSFTDLLEKSRVINQGPDERSYHIFYQILKSAPDDLHSKQKPF